MPPRKSPASRKPASRKPATKKAAHKRTVKKVIADLQSQGPVVVAPGVETAPAAVVVPATSSQPAMVVPATATGIPMAPTMPTNMQVARAQTAFEKSLSGVKLKSLSTVPLGPGCMDGYSWDTERKICRKNNFSLTPFAGTINKNCQMGNVWDEAQQRCISAGQKSISQCEPGFYWDGTACRDNSMRSRY